MRKSLTRKNDGHGGALSKRYERRLKRDAKQAMSEEELNVLKKRQASNSKSYRANLTDDQKQNSREKDRMRKS